MVWIRRDGDAGDDGKLAARATKRYVMAIESNGWFVSRLRHVRSADGESRCTWQHGNFRLEYERLADVGDRCRWQNHDAGVCEREVE